MLVESRVHVEQGFTTGASKLAFVDGRVESTVTLPEGVFPLRSTMTRAPAARSPVASAKRTPVAREKLRGFSVVAGRSGTRLPVTPTHCYTMGDPSHSSKTWEGCAARGGSNRSVSTEARGG